MSGSALKVMTFNLRRRKVSDGKNTWRWRRDACFHVIDKYQPDILGTQEGLQDQVEDLLIAFPEYAFLGEARFGGRDDEFNAILYKPDRFKPISQGNFWHSNTPEQPGSRSWGNYVPRMATWARFQDQDAGHTVFCMNTHLDHLVPLARKRAAHLIRSRLPEDETVILTGDFNAPPPSGTYRFLTRSMQGPRLTDSLLVAKDRPQTRWNPTFHKFTGRGLYRIDYVFTRNVARVRKHRVVRDHLQGKYPSDHFPVYAELELPPPAAPVPA